MKYRLFRRSKPAAAATTAAVRPKEPASEVLHPKKSRIPLALQAVFLASNRGHDVHEPPPGQAANRTFGQRFWKRRNTQSAKAPPSPGHTEQSESTDTTESTFEATDTTTAHCRSSSTPLGTFIQCLDKQQDVYNSPRRKGVNMTELSAPLPKKTPTLTPQSYLNALMRSRGYPVVNYHSLQSAYYNKPTELQQASYDVHLIDLVKEHQLDELRDCLATGLSPNPCNAWGESVLHLLCRRGCTPDVLQVFLEAGADVQVVDDYGRSPLHDACWSVSPCMDTIKLLLDHDVHLLQMRDCRGAQPLSYVPEAHWADWMAFLNEHKDHYFPILRPGSSASAIPLSVVPPLTQQAPNSRPVPDPVNALPIDMARMVASGRMTPAEVALLLDDDDDDDESDSGSDEDDEGWESNYGDSVEHEDDFTMEEEEEDDEDDDDNSSLSTNEDLSLDEKANEQQAPLPVVPVESNSVRTNRSILFGGRAYSFSDSEGDQTPIPAMHKDGSTEDEDGDDEDQDDLSSYDDEDEEDDDASLLEEVVGILGIARPQYQSSLYKMPAQLQAEEQEDETSLPPPIKSVVVTTPRASRRNSECSATSSTAVAACASATAPHDASLLLSLNQMSENDDLLAFSC